MNKPNRRGVMGVDNVAPIAMTMIFVAAIFVGGYLVLEGLASADSDVLDNTTTAAVDNMTLSFDNIITYAPTWGTIIGVSVLIGVVIVGFAVGRSRGLL